MHDPLYENEIQNFWCVVRDLRKATTSGASSETVEYLLEDLRCIEMHTDNDKLRARCADILAETAAASCGLSA